MSLNSIFLSVVFAISLTASLVAQTKSTEATESKESAAQEPEVEQVEQDDDLAAAYESVELRGWTLMVNRQLKADKPDLTATYLELMDVQLRRVEDVVPAEPLRHLKTVRIWANPVYENVKPTAEYHPGLEFLKKQNRVTAMVKCIEITNVDRFRFQCKRMPYMVLHELAHAYHDQVLGFNDTRIRDVFEAAEASGGYDEVDRFNGHKIVKDKAYALSNHKEYFAESTEAYFGRNDFYPFTRKDLQHHDPGMLTLLEEVWQVNAEE